ncbi:flagellar biosynthetic protein FliO [Sphingomonas quercus]|uniref:Flagellar biosynthetic protein FliO n=1 Tax=Sphingomonas quercus TaxID=2842451 RepID=A0ABS6BLW7_9SPHN|nr:flagellar biosynthetic protein FliO [Sphingomonas quercus]MBU3078607.1 flagellar biosynthetic protein FliO [Sphingomonas quercus]
MDFLALLRTFGALGVVLGLLVGALWLVRRYNIKLPGGMVVGHNGERRLAVVERISIDARRSVALIRRDDTEHLVMIAPEGLLLLDAAPGTSTRPPVARKAGFPNA